MQTLINSTGLESQSEGGSQNPPGFLFKAGVKAQLCKDVLERQNSVLIYLKVAQRREF